MKQIGVIIEVHEDKAVVQIKRATACGEKCGQCSGCESTMNEVWAINVAGAKIGQTVIMELDDANVLFAAFVMYIVPVIMLFIGIFLGFTVFNNGLASVIAGLVLMISTFILIKKMDSKFSSFGKFKPIITKIIS